MTALTQIAVGAGVVVLVVGAIIWLAKRGTFEPEATNEESQREREELAESVSATDYHIPFRKRVSSWSGPMKVFVASLGLLAMVGGAIVYQIMRTGSPANQYLTREVQFALVGVIGVAGGVHLKSWFDDQLGYVDVTYERAGAENLVERIPYAKTSERRDGTIKVQEVAPTRLFGLFWRYRQVGEDRRLRGADKPLDDVITLQIPDHGEERPDGSGFHVTTSENGDRVLAGATATADLTFGSPNNLSDERSIQLREKNKRKEAELRAVQSTNAQLQQEVRKLRKKVENEEYDDRAALMEDFGNFAEMFSTLRVNVKDETSEKSVVDKEEASA